MQTQERLIYRLVGMLLPYMSPEKVCDIAEDYAEYLNLKDPSEKVESPWQFSRSVMEGERKHFKVSVLLAGLAAVVLLLTCLIPWKSWISQVILTVGYPLILWWAMSGNTLARYSPIQTHPWRYVLPTALAVTGTIAGFVLWIQWILARVNQGNIVPIAQRFGVAVEWCVQLYLILTVVFLYLTVSRSIWYVCPMIQMWAGWNSFRWLYRFLTAMDVNGMPFENFYWWGYAFQTALGIGMSVLFAWYLGRIAGKETASWTTAK